MSRQEGEAVVVAVPTKDPDAWGLYVRIHDRLWSGDLYWVDHDHYMANSHWFHGRMPH